MNPKESTVHRAPMPPQAKRRNPGFQDLLVSQEAFELVKQLQKRSFGHAEDARAMMVDLKYVATELVLMAFNTPGLPEQALANASRNVASRVLEGFNNPTTKENPV